MVLIDAAWGLGENVVQGAVDPDEYQAFKPLLSDTSCGQSSRRSSAVRCKRWSTPKTVQADAQRPTSRNERACFCA